VLEGSLDERMAEIIIDKQKVLDAALDDQKEAPRVEVKADDTLTPEKKAATWSDDLAGGVTEAQAVAVHEGLKMLATICDGALAEDGRGFNKLDTQTGKSLAAASKLSPKQAKLGKRLVTKYKKQLPAQLLWKAGVMNDVQ